MASIYDKNHILKMSVYMLYFHLLNFVVQVANGGESQINVLSFYIIAQNIQKMT